MEPSSNDEGPEFEKRSRIDHRTGKRIYQHDAAFWRGHVEEWARLGESVSAYCMTHGFATSTFRRWAQRLSAQGQRPTSDKKADFLQVPIVAARNDEAVSDSVEMSLADGMRIKLEGAAARRAIELVLLRLERATR
jgi:hypothetical protein